jgi:hypothetical protein
MRTQKFSQNQKSVSFAEATALIRPGDLFFTAGEYTFSGAIKKITNSDVSHVGVIGNIYDRWVVFESAEGDGVRVVSLAHYLFNYENTKAAYKGKLFIARHRGFPQSPEVQKVFFQVAVDLLNYNYDNREGKKILMDRLLRMGKRQENDAYICSEYVERLFFSINLKFQGNEKGFVFPEHIAADPNVDVLFEIRP